MYSDRCSLVDVGIAASKIFGVLLEDGGDDASGAGDGIVCNIQCSYNRSLLL